MNGWIVGFWSVTKRDGAGSVTVLLGLQNDPAVMAKVVKCRELGHTVRLEEAWSQPKAVKR